MSEKPTRVEVGQRWQSRYHAWWEIVRPTGNDYWTTRNDRGETSQCSSEWLIDNGTFLGWAPGYAPSPETEPPVMGEWHGDPIGCLSCGSKELHCVHFCAGCSPASIPYTKEQKALILTWAKGARDFPRRPPMETPAAAAPKVEPACTKWRTGGDYCGECIECRERIAALRRVPPTPKVEPAPMRPPPISPEEQAKRAPPSPDTLIADVDNVRVAPGKLLKSTPIKMPTPPFREKYNLTTGQPISALEAIQAKPKPEPYICPVDDWDLLPDAGR